MTSLRTRMTEDMQMRILQSIPRTRTCSRSPCSPAISTSRPNYWT